MLKVPLSTKIRRETVNYRITQDGLKELVLKVLLLWSC